MPGGFCQRTPSHARTCAFEVSQTLQPVRILEGTAFFPLSLKDGRPFIWHGEGEERHSELRSHQAALPRKVLARCWPPATAGWSSDSDGWTRPCQLRRASHRAGHGLVPSAAAAPGGTGGIWESSQPAWDKSALHTSVPCPGSMLPGETREWGAQPWVQGSIGPSERRWPALPSFPTPPGLFIQLKQLVAFKGCTQAFWEYLCCTLV